MGLNDIMRKVAEQHRQSTEASKASAIEIKAGAKLIDIADKLTEDMIVFICSVHQRNRIIEAWRQMIQDYENIIKLIRDENLHKWENIGSTD